MIEPHDLFKYWRADQVAECMDGVTDALYLTLWDQIIPHQSDESQETPEPGRESLSKYWHLLSETDQTLLNTLAADHEAKKFYDTIFCHLSPAE